MGSSLRAYTQKMEKEKNELVNTSLSHAAPIATVGFEGGVIVIAENPTPFRKIRRLGKKIIFAAMGEMVAINETFGDLIRSVNFVENMFSENDVSLESLIDNPGGVVSHLHSMFYSASSRPKIIKFVLGFVEKRKGNYGVVINYRGERTYWNNSTLLSRNEEEVNILAKVGKAEQIKNSEDAMKLAISFLEKNSEDNNKHLKKYEVGILFSDGTFKHFWKEVEKHAE